jgi:hypothetical protein
MERDKDRQKEVIALSASSKEKGGIATPIKASSDSSSYNPGFGATIVCP